MRLALLLLVGLFIPLCAHAQSRTFTVPFGQSIVIPGTQLGNYFEQDPNIVQLSIDPQGQLVAYGAAVGKTLVYYWEGGIMQLATVEVVAPQLTEEGRRPQQVFSAGPIPGASYHYYRFLVSSNLQPSQFFEDPLYNHILYLSVPAIDGRLSAMG